MVSKIYLSLLTLQYAAKSLAAPVVDILDRSGNIFTRQGNNPWLNHCEQGCSTCHGAIRTAGLSGDNSQCTSFNSQDTFPASYQNDAGGWNVFLDTNNAIGGFVNKIVVRSPAGTDIDGCGVPTRIISTNGCYQNTFSSTFLLQYCQGEAACDAITPQAEEMALADQLRADSPTGEPNITAWNIGVAEIRRKRKAKRDLEKAVLNKRDCESLSGNGGTYTKLADYSVRASTTQPCSAGNGGTCQISVGQEASISFTLSVEVSAGVEGLFSTSLGFSLETSTSSSVTTSFSQAGGSNGYVAWTPIYLCQDGTLSGCSGSVSDGPVTGCRANKIKVGDQEFLDGVYSFVNVS